MQVVFLQLQPNNSYSHVTWRRMFRVLLEICKLYAGIEADTRVSLNPILTLSDPDSGLNPNDNLHPNPDPSPKPTPNPHGLQLMHSIKQPATIPSGTAHQCMP